jgi:hypothetical protein
LNFCVPIQRQKLNDRQLQVACTLYCAGNGFCVTSNLNVQRPTIF